MFLLIVLFASVHGMMEIPDMDADAAYNCINTVVCKLRRAYELRKVFEIMEEELRIEAIGWIAECHDLDDSDVELYWSTYSDSICDKPMDARRECTRDAFVKFAEYYEEVCESNLNYEACTSSEEAIAAAIMMVENYTASGDCNNPMTIAEDMAESGQKMMPSGTEEMAEKIPSFG